MAVNMASLSKLFLMSSFGKFDARVGETASVSTSAFA